MTDYPPKITNTPGHAFCGRVPAETRLRHGGLPSQWDEAPDGEPSLLSAFFAAGGFLLITIVVLAVFEALR